ncbi:MAG: large conductance mechanosensitive channel protein MscL [Clostridia bacterium]|nr:large conductance mechanosensitive channel protein MscL [Clostridia bacterium]
MKKFFGEFKKFITRGNVLDMAVGVIVGGAFTGIVNGLSNYILKPIINWLLALVLGADGLAGAVTILSAGYKTVTETVDIAGTPTEVTKKVVDLANSIYIDWGAFISAIINFLLIAFTLFTIVKIFNKVKENNEKLNATIKKNTLDRAERKELKAAGVDIRDKQAVKAYFEKKELDAKAQAELEAKQAEEKAKADRLANPTTEDLLKDIKALLEQSIAK